MFESQRLNATLYKVLQAIILIYQGVATLAFVIALILGNHWLKLPFLGAFFEQTLAYNGSGPSQPSEAWDLYNQGIQLGEQLVSINGVEVHSQADIESVLTGKTPGMSVPVVTRRMDGDIREYNVTLHTFPASDRNAYLIIPSIISAIFLTTSVWIFGLRRSESAGRAFSIFATSLAIITGTLFDLYTTNRFPYLWTFGLAMVGGAMVDLALAFPQEFKFVINRPYLRWVGYAVGLILTIYAYFWLFNFEQPAAYYRPWQFLYAFMGACGLIFLSIMASHAIVARSPVVKSQARTILIGALLGLGPAIVWLLINPLVALLFHSPAGPPFTPLLFLPIVIFPISLGYTILRYRLLQTDAWMRQSLIYALFTIVAIGAYGVIVTGISLVFRVPANNPWLIGGLAFLMAILLNPLHNRLQSAVDITFFRGKHAYLQSQQEFTHKLASIVDQVGISQALRETVMSALSPNRAHIYVYESLNDQYASMPGADNRPTSEIRFPANSPLAQYFQQERLPLYLDGANLPASLKVEESRLSLLAARLFIRLPGKERPLGWIAMGPRLSGQPYAPQDLTFTENLCEQAALSIERAQTVSDLERRVQEMNALARVSQGVNITLTFDDVLELIYAQTVQIIPASDFHITLYNKATDYYYYGFCVENRDRRKEDENVPLPPNSGLAQDVIRKGRPLLTQDYVRECQARNTIPDEEGVFAWMGVPLNAGAETIGTLSIGSHDAIINYTRGQLELLQNIADHTAGAIVKSRLLQETERRAHQLTTLNEITRQLTSTLESEPCSTTSSRTL
jgi:GAF domain-containing protein